MRARAHAAGLALAWSLFAGPALASAGEGAGPAAAPAVPIAAPAASPATTADAAPEPPSPTRSGREIYASFRDGLADPACTPDASTRWRQHFAHVPRQLATGGRGNDVLPLFGYVVDALRAAHLPTEYALIPFVESGYRPGARSAAGPAGLWQFIGVTARNHKIAIRPGYDGRLSPVDSTRAAVRYLKTLHGMFAGDWRLAVMAFNAGEYRVLGALKRHGQRAMDAEPARLSSLAGITQAYVRKLHALSCVLAEADDSADWMQALDRQVPRLTAVELPPGIGSLDAWAARQGLDPAVVRRLNPAYGEGRIARVAAGAHVLVPAAPRVPAADAMLALATLPASLEPPPPSAAASASGTFPTPDATPAAGAGTGARTHTVARGESAWTIAHRHGITVAQLLARNGLHARSVLRPGMVLVLDAAPAEPGAGAASVAN